MFTVEMSNSQGRSFYLGESIRPGTWFLAKMLVLLGEAYVIEYWELRPKGRTVLNALIQCISQDKSWFGGNIQEAGFSHCVSKLCLLELKWQ